MKRMKWLTYHIYRWYWSNAVYKYVDIYNSRFNCRRGKKKHKSLKGTFHSGSTLESFQAQERRNEAGSMWRCCSEASEEWLVRGWSRAHRSGRLNDETARVFIAKATVIPYIPACFHSCRRRQFTYCASVCKAPPVVQVGCQECQKSK